MCTKNVLSLAKKYSCWPHCQVLNFQHLLNKFRKQVSDSLLLLFQFHHISKSALMLQGSEHSCLGIYHFENYSLNELLILIFSYHMLKWNNSTAVVNSFSYKVSKIVPS